MKPVITIVGRPNVGKSTLFNRILGYRKAIVEDAPGVTRDRNYGEFTYRGNSFTLVDTGGFVPLSDDVIFNLVEEQIFFSVRESSLVLFVVDGREGIHPHDMDTAEKLRKLGKRVFCVVNKMDSQKTHIKAYEFHELGFEELYMVSALHGTGIGELLDGIYDVLQGSALTDEVEEEGEKNFKEGYLLKIAIVGRPNTGKSSIVNKILGEERMIVSDISGTTRDAIDSEFDYGDRKIIIIDTAGLRKKNRISEKIEGHSVAHAIKSIERADVVNLIIDGTEGPSHQDSAIAHTVVKRGKGLCIVINKWDLMDKKGEPKAYTKMVRERIPHASFAPVLFVSAKTGLNIEKILKENLKIRSQMEMRISTPELNRALEEITDAVSPPMISGKKIRLLYINQPKTTPPTFVVFSNHPESISDQYKRYLEREIRRRFGFTGVTIRLYFRKK
ncbi:MAG: ribosome biogenesis GTPase Der [Syntrophorhabdaceae bacterium]|nr:ribosome biogenesis GTPase Der [Syntrophorhabdaceae bacterium]